MHKQNSQRSAGFTIVELLIVIVVIAILATISAVAYNGIQQRANNAAIVDAASKSLRAMQAYIAVNNKYPTATPGNICVTVDSGCKEAVNTINGSSTFDSEMAAIATLPKAVPTSDTYYGIWFTYNGGMLLYGESRPMRLTYYLNGTGQNCGVDGVVNYTWPDFSTSTTGYTSGNVDGRTRCWVSVPGPSA